MDDHLHGQHEITGELQHQDGSASIYESVGGNSNRTSKTIMSNLGVIDKKCSHQRQTCQDEQNLHLGDKVPLSGSNIESLRRRSPESVPKSTRSMHAHMDDVDNTSSNIEQHDDNDKNDSVEQLRNGCDKTSFDQNQDIYVLPGQLEDIKLNQAFSDEVLKENVPEKSRTNKTDYINSSPSTYKTNSTFTSCDSSAVIPLAGLNTTKARDSDEYKPEKDKKEPCIKQRLDEDAEIREIDEHNLLYKQNQRESHHSKDHRQKSSQLSNHEDELGTRSRKANTDVIDPTYHNDDDENIDDEGVVITRSSSLSSQKTGIALKSQSLESRPIYPNVPYSPYASPYSSPRSNRRRPPLRESRRISIEQSGSFLQLNQYKLMDQIGQGSYGLVKLAYSEEDSTHYAMKILSKRRLLRQAGLMKRGPKKSTSPLDRVYREIAVLKKLDHPNVVKLVEVLDDPVEDSLYMVFELVKQGEVLSVPTKNPLTEERSWSVFRDTLLGLEYLHYQRIIHADIKPGNLLLTECGRVKIADLGVCNEFIGEDATMTNCSTAGTPAFRPPESLNVGQNMYCGKAADIWALGATLYALVYGNVPFEAPSVPALYEKIKNEELSFPENPKTSVELRDCIQCMLKKDPADRITLPQLKEHVWVTAGGLHPLPSEEENCRLVQVNDDDINSVVRSIPKLDTLILIKTMLKKHSFGNPFSRGISGRAPQRGGSRLERFIRAGRSNSAPGSYNMIVDRQLSGDNILPALSEHSPSNCTNEESQ
ncbi:calcium/calmodulin-dependent protein kinase kinase 1 isoform X4 [Lucilia sericata]|uniref:calcium/calmodulin-dependent protein kinase kinase 1 isoform X4 n=1 Tax=Lucilia sericata TaxID=13632 RepID=UPI0018A83424|nr:calcium/calmodulin-dependent protein kinase kinase 1 isoform X4 [Lucilia sericata]